MRRIVLPQAVRIVTPAIGNEFIAMIKDSALVVGTSASRRSSGARSTTGSRLTSGRWRRCSWRPLVYWVLTIVFSVVQERLERRLRESDVRV